MSPEGNHKLALGTTLIELGKKTRITEAGSENLENATVFNYFYAFGTYEILILKHTHIFFRDIVWANLLWKCRSSSI